MSPVLVYILLALALVLPVLGALLIRLLLERLSEAQVVVGVALLVLVAIASALVLARSDVQRLGVGNLNLLRPIIGMQSNVTPQPSPTLPPDAFLRPATRTPTASATRTATATPTITPTATLTGTTTVTDETPTRTPTPTATPEPTAEPTAEPTDEPTLTPTATPEPEPTAEPAPEPEPEQQVYVVEPGDTLRGIAEDFDVSVEELLDANGLTPEEGDEIRPGQELIIP